MRKLPAIGPGLKWITWLLIGLSAVLVQNCQQFEPDGFLYITTGEPEVLGGHRYRLKGTIVDVGTDPVTEHGFCFSPDPQPVVDGSEIRLGAAPGPGDFSTEVSGLPFQTKIYIRTFAITANGTEYGSEKSLVTAAPDLPEVETTFPHEITTNTAAAGGIIISDGGSEIIQKGICWSNAPQPDLTGPHTEEGSGPDHFTGTLEGLDPNALYFLRAYATNEAGTAYGREFPVRTYRGTIQDVDGNVYYTIEIGDQHWMASNLRAIHYADGSEIPMVEEIQEWESLNENDAAFSWFENNPDMAEMLGALYSWAAAMGGSMGSTLNPSDVQGVCPDGWHLPSDTEWKQLETGLGMSPADADLEGWRGNPAGGLMKIPGSEAWQSPNVEASNASGFTVHPAGVRDPEGNFRDGGLNAFFWTASDQDPAIAWDRMLAFDQGGIAREAALKKTGMAVRCLEGEASVQPPTVVTAASFDITESSARVGGAVTSDGGIPVTERGICWSPQPHPTLEDQVVPAGSGGGEYDAMLQNLDPFREYFVRAYATNGAGTAYGEEISFRTLWDQSQVSDYEGNLYHTVQIGNQVWMTENLRSTRYADGSAIPVVADSSDWSSLAVDDRAYCWYLNDSGNKMIHGALYNWTAAMNGEPGNDNNPSMVQGVCPAGWHLPSDEEWKELEVYLGMSRMEADKEVWRGSDEGGKLKLEGTEIWAEPNTGATNESGFSGIPGGYRQTSGKYSFLDCYAVYWTTTPYDEESAWHRNLLCDYEQVYRYHYSKGGGFSVRCMKNP